jgi:hypothetical protein
MQKEASVLTEASFLVLRKNYSGKVSPKRK